MIVITGATGNIGRPLVERLAQDGEQVTAVSRRQGDREPQPGIVEHRADLADPQSLQPALQGAAAVFLLVAGELLAAGDDPAVLLRLIKDAGVQRVVLLSSQAAGTRPSAISHERLRQFEKAALGSGLATTILRPGGFATNAYAWAEPIRRSRAVAAPFADVGLPVIDPCDIADAAAVTLRDPGHAGRTYVLTGPAAVSPRQRVQAIGDAIGVDIEFTEQTRNEARAQMLQFMPEPVVDGTLDILGDPTREEQAVSPDLAGVLDREATSFAIWAHRNRAAFA